MKIHHVNWCWNWSVLTFKIYDVSSVPAATTLNSESAKLKILAAGTKLKVWNVKTSNVKNTPTSTDKIMFSFDPIFKILEGISSSYAFY